MGIPRFVSNYLRGLKNAQGNNIKFSSEDQPKKVETLCIDFNSLIHEKAMEIFHYFNERDAPEEIRMELIEKMKEPIQYIPPLLEEESIRTRDKSAEELSIQDLFRLTNTKTYEELERDLFRAIYRDLEKMIKTLNPKTCYIATDGVPPTAKIVQQRSRRYASKSVNGLWDSNCISPGTDFMKRLETELVGSKTKGVYEKKGRLQALKDLGCNIIYSPDTVRGEGEHKIMRYLDSIKDETEQGFAHVIYGKDADLTVLCVMRNISNCFTFSIDDRSRFKKVTKFIYYNIDVIKEYFFDKKINAVDFMILSIFLGNDFVHKPPNFIIVQGEDEEINQNKRKEVNILYLLTEAYTTFRSDSSKPILLDENENINWDLLVQILKIVNKDDFNIKRVISTKFDYPDEIFEEIKADKQKIENSDKDIDPESIYDDDLKKFEILWKRRCLYPKGKSLLRDSLLDENLFNGEAEKSFHLKYKGMFQWIYDYYSGKEINENVFFNYYYSPYLCDTFYRNVLNDDLYFEEKPKLGIFEQMISILPPKSIKLFPEKLRNELRKNFNVLTWVMPNKVNVYNRALMVGHEHQGIVMVPYPNFDLVRKMKFFFPEVEQSMSGNGEVLKLDYVERKMNKFGNIRFLRQVWGDSIKPIRLNNGYDIKIEEDIVKESVMEEHKPFLQFVRENAGIFKDFNYSTPMAKIQKKIISIFNGKFVTEDILVGAKARLLDRLPKGERRYFNNLNNESKERIYSYLSYIPWAKDKNTQLINYLKTSGGSDAEIYENMFKINFPDSASGMLEVLAVNGSFNEAENESRNNKRLRDILKMLPKNFTPKRVLDIGCGDGGVLIKLSKFFGLSKENVVGIDVREIKSDKFTFMKVSESETKFDLDKNFDLIICLHTLHHSRNLEYLLKEISRLSDGYVVIREHDCENEQEQMIIDITHGFYELVATNPQENPNHNNDYYSLYFSKEDMERILKEYCDMRIVTSTEPEGIDKSYYTVAKKNNVVFKFDKLLETSPIVFPISIEGDGEKEDFEKVRKFLLEKESDLNKNKALLDVLAKEDNYIKFNGIYDLYHSIKLEFGKKYNIDNPTNASTKIHEILLEFDLLSELPEDPVVFLNAELPGAFIKQLLHDYKGDLNWYGASYDNSFEKDKYLGDIYNMWKNNKERWLMNISKSALDGTETINFGNGDATDTTNIRKYEKFFSGMVDLYTHDAGIGVGSDYDNQEKLNSRVHLGCALSGFVSLRKGGNFVAKQYLWFNEMTYKLLYLYSTLFDEFYISKPLTSRPINSETYLIGKGFKGMSEEVREILFGLLENKDLLGKIEVDSGFNRKMLNITEIIVAKQIAYLRELSNHYTMYRGDYRKYQCDVSKYTDKAVELYFNRYPMTVGISEFFKSFEPVDYSNVLDWNLFPTKENTETTEKLKRINLHLGQAKSIEKVSIENLERVLSDSAQRDKYFSRENELKTVNHWGQRKLLVSEIEFLTMKYTNRIDYVIYAGAAPGTHIPFLVNLFPGIKFVLVDPSEFCVRESENIIIRKEYFTDAIAEEYSKFKTLFISDIRSTDYKVEGNEEVEEGVKNDMIRQAQWAIKLKCSASMVKFRPPYGSGEITYLDGDIYLPVWGPATTTESRLITTDHSSRKVYNNKKYEEQMFHFNTVTRTNYYNHDIKSEGLCHCFDCSSESVIIFKYIVRYTNPELLTMDYIKSKIEEFIQEITKACNYCGDRTLNVSIQCTQRKFAPKVYNERDNKVTIANAQRKTDKRAVREDMSYTI